MFIMIGSMIRQAISAPRSSSTRASASASLNGTTRVCFTASAGMPFDSGVEAGASRPPITSEFGTTENITASWWPWYDPSIFRITSRPVAPRARRIASMVASVPEFVNRT